MESDGIGGAISDGDKLGGTPDIQWDVKDSVSEVVEFVAGEKDTGEGEGQAVKVRGDKVKIYAKGDPKEILKGFTDHKLWEKARSMIATYRKAINTRKSKIKRSVGNRQTHEKAITEYQKLMKEKLYLLMQQQQELNNQAR